MCIANFPILTILKLNILLLTFYWQIFNTGLFCSFQYFLYQIILISAFEDKYWIVLICILILVGPEIWGPSSLCVKGPKPGPRSPSAEDARWKLLEGPRMWSRNLKKRINSVQEQYKGESCQHRNVELSTWQAHTLDHAIQLFPTTPNHSDVWIDRTSNYPKKGKTDT